MSCAFNELISCHLGYTVHASSCSEELIDRRSKCQMCVSISGYQKVISEVRPRLAEMMGANATDVATRLFFCLPYGEKNTAIGRVRYSMNAYENNIGDPKTPDSGRMQACSWRRFFGHCRCCRGCCSRAVTTWFFRNLATPKRNRLEAIAIRLEAIASRLEPSLLGSRPSLLG